MSLTAQVVEAAARRVHARLEATPLLHARAWSSRLGLDVWLKLDNLQVTGSFKARGAVHKLACLSPAQREAGVVAASSGNHGRALAWAARQVGCAVEVHVPRHCDASKAEAIEKLGANLRWVGDDCTEAEASARATAEASGRVYVSPYNDLEVVAGQGSLGVELVEQSAAPFDEVFIALGGGGLAAGVGTIVHASWPTCRIVGVSPERSPALHACMQAGEIIEVACGPTLSDGTAGGVEAGAVSFAWAQRELAASHLVSESEIATAMRRAALEQGLVIEGAAGVALAGLWKHAEALRGRRVCVVICGGNVARETLAGVLAAPR